ncbi:MAG: HAMP domain-containing histidine kinase [bacterium]|nr:HAMP domain-containing histidine kinase [bacterium]
MIPDWYSGLKRVLTRLGILPLSLWVILLIVNLTVLILPLGSIFFFRIYENQLIAETEAELISQSVYIGEMYKREIRDQLEEKTRDEYGRVLEKPPPKASVDFYTPLTPKLDLATGTIYPKRPDGGLPTTPADTAAIAAGRNLNEMLLEAQRTTLAGIRVLDFNGTVIAGANENGLSFAHVSEVIGALNGDYTSVIRQRISDEPPPSIASISRGTGIRIFTVYPIISNDHLWGAVYLSRTPKSILKHMFAERTKVILAGLSMLAMTLFIVVITSWTIVRPIYLLIERTKKISAGDKEALEPIELPGTKEMALLTRSFSDTARSLHERSNYIKNFATHVSHELKTPLTSIRGAAELLGEHFEEMTPDERLRFLTNIQDDSDRLKILVSRLLELAQADGFTPSTETSDLLEVLGTLIKKYQSAELKLHVSESSSLMVKMSKEVVEMIFTNLIDNAKKHRASEIFIEIERVGEQVEIIFADDGDGISKANARKIFDPFFTTRRESGGTGIGLGIVKSLIENHHGSIRLHESEKGARFAVSLLAKEYTGFYGT